MAKTECNDDKAIKIDLKGIIRQRLGGASRLIPPFMVRKLEDLICQEKLNELLERNFPLTGADFCRAVLNDLNINVRVINTQRLPEADDKRLIIVSNHPLGGLDGMVLIDTFTRRYGNGVRFIVNDLLTAVRPLAGVFLPINTHGRQNRQAITAIDHEMRGDNPIIIFPAGICSRQDKKGAEVADREWKKMFINKAIEHHRDIVPLFFDGVNSPRFYTGARRREALGLKFNFEMALLPSEVFRSEGKSFRINCGERISWECFSGGNEAADEAQAVRRIVYDLKKELYTDN